MATKLNSNVGVWSVFLTVMFCHSCESIKCFSCNSANNSACLEMHVKKMQAVVPIVDCQQTMPGGLSNEFFCRKMVQTILHVDHTPEVRITRGCGWVKHKRECYKADNSDHLETVCQCFGDMCNAATSLAHVKLTVLGAVAALLALYRTWRGSLFE